MNAIIMKDKVRPEQLTKLALIYLRLSSPVSVRTNPDNVARHYDLKQLALDYGWQPTNIVIVEQDLGRTGEFMEGRSGFKWALQEVAKGTVGAIFCMEAPRLARCDSDFAFLVKCCRYTNTLIIDPGAAYHPNDHNDRILLSFKGTMSETELELIRTRISQQRLYLARQGKLHLPLPTGFIYGPNKEVIPDPDPDIKKTFEIFFKTFEECGSASALVREFAKKNVLFPTRITVGLRKGKVDWKPLTRVRALDVLHNSIYAGDFVYGRTKITVEPELGDTPKFKKRQVQLKYEDWGVVIEGRHQGYITKERFLWNLEQLSKKCTHETTHETYGKLEDAPLLQGVAVCGKCKLKMHVRRDPKSRRHRYTCMDRKTYRQTIGCHSLIATSAAGVSVDEAVARVLLEAMEPTQLQLSIKSLEQFEERERDIQRVWEQRIKGAQEEADKTRKDWEQASEKNYLVKETLEREWNDKLLKVQSLKRAQEEQPQPKLLNLTPDKEQSIKELAQDFPATWNAHTTTPAERRTLLRHLIEEVALLKLEHTIQVTIRWRTKALTVINLDLQQVWTYDFLRVDPSAINEIRKLAPTHADREIAQLLNEAGLRGKRNSQFNYFTVRQIRDRYDIPTGCPTRVPKEQQDQPRGDGRYTTLGVAKKLNVSRSTVQNLCNDGTLDVIRSGQKNRDMWIKLTPEDVQRLSRPEGAYHLPRVKSQVNPSQQRNKAKQSGFQANLTDKHEGVTV